MYAVICILVNNQPPHAIGIATALVRSTGRALPISLFVYQGN